MNTIINKTGYPVFTPNQVLTKDDLNNLVNYLDEQNRLTRAHMIGMGIICGMEVSSSDETEDTKIYISAGCGITSEGYVISLSSIELTHYQSEVEVQSLLFALSDEDASTTSSRQYTVVELFETNEENPNNQKLPLDKEFEDFIADKVLVVVFETLHEQGDSFLLEYNELGKYKNFRLRFFLLPRLHNPETPKQLSAETLLRNGYQIDQLEEPWKDFSTEVIFETPNHFLQEFDLEAEKFQDFAPQVQRFGYVQDDLTGKRVDLTKINDYKAFRENYYLVCVNAIAAIDNAFTKLFRLFSPFFSSFKPNSLDFSTLKTHLESLLEGIKPEEIRQKAVPPEKVQSTYYLQYFYDYLSLLVAAYYELAEAAFDLMDDCTPDTQRFPKFLMLGLVPSPSQATEVYAAPSAYRSHFTQPPIYNGNQVRIKQVRYLYERLLKLCEINNQKDEKNSFYLLPFYNTPLKITPSKDQSTPLSNQAIPYYLNYPNLYKYWSYDAYRKGRSHLPSAYFSLKKDDKKTSIPNREDLVYRLDDYNFYRIEGHVGKANGDVVKNIQEYQQRYNLAFDVVTLKLSSQASLQDLNLSGRFDDLESDFRRMKETFQKLWSNYVTKHENDPQNNFDPEKNVFLQTLKRVFFDQPGLTVINRSQLFNPILKIAREPENYEFVKRDTDADGQYRLFVGNKTNRHIARYVMQTEGTEGNSLNEFNDHYIDFSGFSNDDAIEEQKKRITEDMADCISRGKITFGIVKDLPSNSDHYHLKLSTEYEVNLPNPDSDNPSRKYSIVLLSLNYFTVSIQDNQPIIEQSEFQNFETLYGLLRDVPAIFNTENYQMGNSDIAEELNYFELLGLIDAYQQRLEQMMKLHLFHKFAQKHPGMEHLGGVPKGGTFILVYVDGQEVNQVLAADKDTTIYELRRLRTENIKKSALFPPDLYQEEIPYPEQLLSELQKRKDVIVGDFCLPYRCSSDAPAVNYVVARQRPIILLNKVRFREDDDNKYEFILEPEGGTVRGEGVSYQENIQKYVFQPTSIGQISKDDLAKGLEVAIIFAYAVDQAYDTLTVTIYPLDAGFKIGDENETSLCAYSNELKLERNIKDEKLQSQYIALDDKQNEIKSAIRKTGNEYKLIPNKVKLGGGKTQKQITIKHTITNQKGYTKSNEKNVTIFALPNAGFKIDGDSNKISFCAYDNELELTPKLKDDNIESEFFAFDSDKKTKLDNVIENNKFNPSAVLGDNKTEKIIYIEHKIKHSVTAEKICEKSERKEVTIFALPNAGFTIGNQENGNQNKIQFSTNDQPVNLNSHENGTEFTSEFKAFYDQNNPNPIENAIKEKENKLQFDPTQVKLDNNKPKTIIIEHTITKNKGCKNSQQQQVEIVPPPDANLSITGGENFSNNATPVEITLANETPEDVELIEVKINDSESETRMLNPSQYATDGKSEDVTITAVIRSRENQYENTLTRTVTINSAPNANLSITGGDNFCNNATPLEITLADGTPEDVELIEVSINNTPTQILNPSQYAKNAQPEDVTIKAVIRSRETQYENTLTRTVTINPLPDANLSITGGQNFCNNGQSLEITLAEGTPEDVELIEVSINDTATRILNPSQYAKNAQPEDVTITAVIRNNQTLCENTLTRTVIINPIPVGDFQAEIANIYANGFSIRVFDIQPAQETSFSFNWEHPGGNRDTSNPGNNEFIINYDYDFNNWIDGAEVSITLQVNTPAALGSCSSEPLTKGVNIPFGGVQGFNLLTIKNDEVIVRKTLESDNSFKVSDFNEDNQYAIEAVTVPEMVDSVVFTYTAPNASVEESPPVNTPHYLPNGWQPIVGIHKIKAQSFREINSNELEGVASIVIIRINVSETSTDTPTPSQPRAVTLLNRMRLLFESSDRDFDSET